MWCVFVCAGIDKIYLMSTCTIQASRVADDFEKKLQHISKLSGPAQEQAVKEAKTQLETLTISTVRKHSFKETIATISKALLEADKALKAAQLKGSIEKVSALLEASESPFVVVQFDDLDPATLQGVLKYVQTKSSKAALLVAVDAEGNKVSHRCMVPKV